MKPHYSNIPGQLQGIKRGVIILHSFSASSSQPLYPLLAFYKSRTFVGDIYCELADEPFKASAPVIPFAK